MVQEAPPLTEELLIVDGLQRKKNPLSLRVWLQIGQSHSSAWSHTWKYTDSINLSQWVS